MQQNWRTLLAIIAKTPAERRELAKKIGITPRTLDRWMTGEAKTPQDYWLQKLIDALPAQRSQIIALLRDEFPNFEPALVPTDEAVKEIPTAFYARVLESNTQIADPLHFWTLASLLLQQMVYQLDPKKVGIQLVVAQCVPPQQEGGAVRSLIEVLEQGTAPWKTTPSSMRGMFLGGESLAGYAAAAGQSVWMQDIASEAHLFPIRKEAYEVSAAAYPIQRKGLVAGALIASSTQRSFFTDTRLKLLYHYTNMLVLAFEPQQFYPQARLHLATFPASSVQAPLFSRFAERLLALRVSFPHASQAELEMKLYQELEEQWIAQEKE